MSEELADKLEQLDRELTGRGVPLVLRPLDSFNRLFSSEHAISERTQVFDSITEWFVGKYGDGVLWDQIIGRQPIVLQDRVCLIEVPFTEFTRTLDVTECLPGLDPKVWKALPQEERLHAMAATSAAFEDFGALYNLETKPSLLTPEQWALTRRARFDLSAAARVLQSSEDTQGSIFHSHQASEKFLKAALLGMGVSEKELRRGYGHSLSKLHDRLSSDHRKYDNFANQIRALEGLLENMKIRYSEMRRSLREASAGFTSARTVCGFIARQWQMDQLRGGPEVDLRVGRLYRDYLGRTYRCTGRNTANGEESWSMMLLEQEVGGMTLDAELRLRGQAGHLFLEVSDPTVVQRLEERYIRLISKRQKR